MLFITRVVLLVLCCVVGAARGAVSSPPPPSPPLPSSPLPFSPPPSFFSPSLPPSFPPPSPPASKWWSGPFATVGTIVLLVLAVCCAGGETLGKWLGPKDGDNSDSTAEKNPSTSQNVGLTEVAKIPMLPF